MITHDQFIRTIEKISVQSVLLDPDDKDDLCSIISLFSELQLWAELHSQDSLASALKNLQTIADRHIHSGFFSHEDFMCMIEKTISEIQFHARHDFDFSGFRPPPELTGHVGHENDSGNVQSESPCPIQTDQNLHHPGSLPGYLDMDLFSEFLSLQNGVLDRIEDLVLRIEQSPSQEDIAEIKRSIHTTKGEAGFLNLEEIESLCHSAEDLISSVYFFEHAGILFSIIDWMRKTYSWYKGETTEPPGSSQPFIDSIAHIIGDKEKVDQDEQDEQDEQDPPLTSFEDLQKTDLPLNVPSIQAGTESPGKIKDAILVETERLDRIIDMIGELVISQSMIMQADEIKAIESQDLKRHLIHMDKITRGLQEAGHTLRMVPIKSTFQKMARLVRDVSKKSGKTVRCDIHGAETELDKIIIDKIGEPLLHIIRNAVDHGIEYPAERSRIGKNPSGTIRLSAYHKSGYILIEIEDDGKGLDRKAILEKAVEKGIVKHNVSLNDRDITQLIFEPGFSTASEITELSGRGVGMNVVKKAIEALHGTIELHSVQGQGSTFMIKIPLTLAIIDGMIVRSGSERFIIPTLSIVMATRISNDKITTLINQSQVADVLNRLIPLFRLSSLLGIETDDMRNDLITLVVVEGNNQRIALIVDELIGKQQIVIKSLGESFQNIRGISGAAIMPDGQVGLIVDIEKLTQTHHSA